MSDRSDSDVAPETRALQGCCTAIEWSNEPCHRQDKSTCQVDDKSLGAKTEEETTTSESSADAAVSINSPGSGTRRALSSIQPATSRGTIGSSKRRLPTQQTATRCYDHRLEELK